MMDLACEIETRNYCIRHKTDPRILMELLRTILSIALVAGVFLFYSWIRSQIVNIGYENQRLLEAEESLLRIQQSLILEEETLKSPERIDAIARNQLGMTTLRPHQLILPKAPDLEKSSASTMAMTNSDDSDLKKPASNN